MTTASPKKFSHPSPSCLVHGAFGPNSQRVRKLEAEGRAEAPGKGQPDGVDDGTPTGRRPHVSAAFAA